MEITEIKQRLSIETVLKHYGLQANRNNMLKCPFHEETEPSLKIYPDTNTFNCFGCKANGDTIEFIQLKEKCNQINKPKRNNTATSPGTTRTPKQKRKNRITNKTV